QLAAALKPNGRVVAIDLPSFGDAPEPEWALIMQELGRVVIDFVAIEQLDHPILVGHSMGTQVVAEAAAQRPDLFPELVLIAPTVNRHERTVRRQSLCMMQDLIAESPRVLALGMSNYVKTGPRWFAMKLGSMMAHRIEDPLARLTAHTFVIRGARDPVCPHDWVEEVSALIPDAHMIEIAGRGHETMVKDGDSAADLIIEHVCS
ncbi:MAG: alpha/beta hydrolase, partial [Microbacteriaceae bacterium]